MVDAQRRQRQKSYPPQMLPAQKCDGHLGLLLSRHNHVLQCAAQHRLHRRLILLGHLDQLSQRAQKRPLHTLFPLGRPHQIAHALGIPLVFRL